jgi:hypothetical protein
VSYELALRARVLDALGRRGRELLAVDQVAALDLFNRALTIDPENREILDQIEQLSRRRRSVRFAALFSSVLVLVALAYGIKLLWFDDGPLPAAEDATRPVPASGVVASPQGSAPSPPVRTGTEAAHAPAEGPARASQPAQLDDAPTRPGTDPAERDPGEDPAPGRQQRPLPLPGTHPLPAVDAGIAAPSTRRFTLNVSPLKSEYRVDDGAWHPIPRGRATVEVGPGAHVVEVRNTTCCESDQQSIAASAGDGVLDFTLGYLPATITPKCPLPGVAVQIDGRSARLDGNHPIFLTGSLGQRTVVITFFNEQTTDEHVVQVQYKETKVVTCGFR